MCLRRRPRTNPLNACSHALASQPQPPHRHQQGCPKIQQLILDDVRFIGPSSLLDYTAEQGHHLTQLVLDGEGLDDRALLAVTGMAAGLKKLHISFSEGFTDEVGQAAPLTHGTIRTVSLTSIIQLARLRCDAFLCLTLPPPPAAAALPTARV